MPAETVDERRIFERFTARFPAKIKDSRTDYGTDVFLRDASASGARIFSRDRFFLEDHLAIEVKLPDGMDPMTMSGKVVWSKPVNASMWDIGLQFSNINLVRMHRLFKFSEDLS